MENITYAEIKRLAACTGLPILWPIATSNIAMWSRNKERELGRPAQHTADAVGGCSMQDTGLNCSSSAAPAAGENRGAASGTSTRRAEQRGAGVSCTSSQPCLFVTALTTPPRHKPVFSAGMPTNPAFAAKVSGKKIKTRWREKCCSCFLASLKQSAAAVQAAATVSQHVSSFDTSVLTEMPDKIIMR